MIDSGTPPLNMMLAEIERDECLELLATQKIGRLAVPDHGHYPPHIVPVNFALDDDRIVLRSNAGLKFKLSILAAHSVSFEVDSIDPSGRMAWSVVVQGRAELLTWEQVKGRGYASALEPWAPGQRSQWIRIVPYTITGRRLRAVPSSPAILR